MTDNVPAIPPRAALALAIVLLLAATLLRGWPVLVNPVMAVEDGTFNFPHFYEEGAFSEVFLRSKSGYIPVPANLIAWLSVRLPTEWIPHGFAFGAWFLYFAAFAVILHPAFRLPLSGPLPAAGVAAGIALLPLASFHHLATADYSNWSSLLLVILVALGMERIPRPLAVFTAFSVWANPLSLCLLPVYAWRAATGRSGCALLVAASIVLQQCWGVSGSGRLLHDGGWAFLRHAAECIPLTFQAVGLMHARFAVGPDLSRAWFAAAPASTVAFALACQAGLALLAWRLPRWRFPLLGTGYVIFSTTYLCLLGRGGTAVLDTMADGTTPRYLFLPVVLLLLVSTMLLLRLLPGRRLATAALVCGWFALHAALWLSSAQARRFYAPKHPDHGDITRAFFQTLAGLEKTTPPGERIDLRMQKTGEWTLYTMEPLIGPGPRPALRHPRERRTPP
jgi:hypothetical protein